jgi:serine/threonine-protein kinase
MSEETDLLKVVIACQMGFVTREQVKNASSERAGKKTLTDALVQKGYLKPGARATVESYISSKTREYGESPEQILGSIQIDEDLLQVLLGLPLEPRIQETLLEWRAGSKPKPAPTAEVLFDDGGETVADSDPSPAAGGLRRSFGRKYEFKGELGRGGLGKVIEAVDRDFGREVAVKMMLPGQSSSAVERFLFEGKAAGRLPHPNIVPIYEVGALKGEKGETPYFTMAKIVGRDLRAILQALGRGDDEAVAKFNRPRLLRIFQEVCNAMAYAHDHGVIHRDLKPANVMVGDYGEVFVVDWGLAKILSPDSPDRPSAESDSPDSQMPGEPSHESRGTSHETEDSPALTLEGQVLGTPAYMPPEQADGRIADIDECSDIYSLGAILYEILTFRPPFEGKSANNVISKVLSDSVTPPSERVSPPPPASESEPKHVSLDAVPPELDEIVLKAMSKEKRERHPSARALSDDIQLYLEGEKERERKRLEAVRLVEEGGNHFERFRTMAGEIETENSSLKEASKKVQAWTPVADKLPLWERRKRLLAMSEERMVEFGNAEVAFGQALASDSANPDARDGLCRLYLDRFFTAEKRRNREEVALYRNLISRYDQEGKWIAEIEKPGSLSIRTFTRSCACLSRVKNPEWRVEFGEDPVWPWHSGRVIPGKPVETEDRPVPEFRILPESARFGHTDDCRLEEVKGVEVYAHRYVEEFKRLVPDEGKLLGKTPLSDVRMDQGSYLCLLRHPDFSDVRLPVRIDRGGDWVQDVNLYRDVEIPEDFCYVPGGPYIEGGEKAGGIAEETRWTEDFFMAKSPVTFGDFIEFLNELQARDPEEALSHQPSEGGEWKFLIVENGKWRINDREERPPLGFQLKAEMPVMGISWFTALAYCAWKSTREGFVYTPPHEEEWEKAARGVDGRVYPWGDEYDGTYSNASGSRKEGVRILAPGSYEVDSSPYNVMDMAGNMRTWCLNLPGGQWNTWRSLRGGAWDFAPIFARGGLRAGEVPTLDVRYLGLRLVFRSSSLTG